MKKNRKTYLKEYNQRPEVRARRNTRQSSLEGKAYMKAYREKLENKVKKKAYMKLYSILPKCIAKQKEYAESEAGKLVKAKAYKKWETKNLHKRRAHDKARYYIKQKEMCEVKNCKKIGEMHHEDYDNPLEVNWLCHNHHLFYHYSYLSLKEFIKKGENNE